MIWRMTRRAYIADGLGERIRRLRKERGWNQTELAQKVGCSRRAVVYYETEGKYPPAPVVAAMAGAFGLDINVFMSPDEPVKKASRSDPDLLNDPEDKRLWRKFRQMRDLNERDQASVMRLLNILVDAKTATTNAVAS